MCAALDALAVYPFGDGNTVSVLQPDHAAHGRRALLDDVQYGFELLFIERLRFSLEAQSQGFGRALLRL